MARRGDALREHILVVAKDVFLESGFERASMDVVAARAETSKRSLYAHFESKDKLFAAVVTLAREMYLDKLKTPADYDGDVTLFCARFLQLLLREPALRTCRMGIAEAERLPEASAGYYDAIFATSHDRLATFLVENRALTPEAAGETATELLGRTVHPRLFRALLGVEKPLPVTADLTTLTTDIDLAPIRAAVDRALG